MYVYVRAHACVCVCVGAVEASFTVRVTIICNECADATKNKPSTERNTLVIEQLQHIPVTAPVLITRTCIPKIWHCNVNPKINPMMFVYTVIT